MKPSDLFMKKTKQEALYNIQPIENISSIMQKGLLSNEKCKGFRHVSIAMQEVQSRRDNIQIPNGMRLHQYVNVYFDPRNPMLSSRRSENDNLCILKIDRVILDFDGTVVSDMNASSAYASFYTPDRGLECINFDMVYAPYWTDSDPYEYFKKKSAKCAEVLVPEEISYDYILAAAVANDRARDKLKAVGFKKQIIVIPKLFF